MKAKAILAPADNDGLEAVFYNFCGVGHSEMDNKGATSSYNVVHLPKVPGFKRLCQDCGIIDKKLEPTNVDLIFADTRVKPYGTKRNSS